MQEIADYVHCGMSVIFYNHRQRKTEELYFYDLKKKLYAEESLAGKGMLAVTFPKSSVRDYFIIANNNEHKAKIELSD